MDAERFLRHQSRPSVTVCGQVVMASLPPGPSGWRQRGSSLSGSVRSARIAAGLRPRQRPARPCHGRRPGLLARVFTSHGDVHSFLQSVNQLPPADTQADRPDEDGLLIWIHSLENPGDDPGHQDLPAAARTSGGTPRSRMPVDGSSLRTMRWRALRFYWPPMDTVKLTVSSRYGDGMYASSRRISFNFLAFSASAGKSTSSDWVASCPGSSRSVP